MQFSISREAPVLLPLNSLGNRPYWFVATARITAASEILCSKDGNPHCDTEMPVLAQEAYYSAALDGAPGDSSLVQEAMSFSDSILHSPLTSSTMMKLAGMLAGPSVTCKSPRHESHVEELVRFLRDPHFHPLVKGTIAHAYILATQPLTVGNGRLARLLTHIVLLRSGYSYLLNASLSAVIARHSADYISAVRSIFLPENAGSLTGFLEFMMEMLVETYREGTIDGEYVEGVQYSESSLSEAEQQTVPSDVLDNQSTLSDSGETITVAGITLNASTDQSFYERLTDLEYSFHQWNRDMASAIHSFLRDGMLEFTYADCLERTGWSIMEYRRAYTALKKRMMVVNMHPVKNRYRNEPGRYRLLLRSADSVAHRESNHSTKNLPGLMKPSQFWERVDNMALSSSDAARKGAVIIKDMISQGIMEFTSTDWILNTHMSPKEFDNVRSHLRFRHLIINLTSVNEKRFGLQARYRFTLGNPADGGDVSHFSSTEDDQKAEIDAATFWKLVSTMDISRSDFIRRIAQTVRDFISVGKMEFTSTEMFDHTGIQRKGHHSLIQWLVSHGMIIRVDTKPKKHDPRRYRFTIAINGPEDIIPPVLPQTPMGKCLYQMENGRSTTLRRGAGIVREMIREGITEFSTDQWLARTGMNLLEYDTIRFTMIYRGALEKAGSQRAERPYEFGRYRFILQESDLQPQVAPGSASTSSRGTAST